MERGLYRFIVGALVGVLIFAGSVEAQQAGSYLPIDQLSAAMLGQEGAAAEESFLDGLQTKGSINVGYSFNFNDSESSSAPGGFGENPGRIFDVFHNEFTIHNAILYLEKPVDNDNLVGFAFTPSIGKDAGVTQAGTNISFGGDDFDVLQLNVQIYAPDDIAILGGTKFEIGKFLTSAGGEVIDAPYNDMFSRSWLFGLAIPFTHTGVRATKTILTRQDEESLLDLQLGIANGWDNHNVGSATVPPSGASNGNFPTWLSSAFFSFGGDLDPTLTVNNFVGETSTSGAYRNLLDLVSSITLFEDLTLSGNFDWITDQVGNVTTGGYGELYGIAGILRYDFGMMSEAKKWYVAMRGEYVDDNDGFAFGAAGLDVFELTWTLGYKPRSNLLLRTEVRYDKANVSGGTGTTSDVFENGDSNHQTTLSFDVSLLF